MFKVDMTKRLTTRGSIRAEVVPAVPCALDDCLAELHLFGKYGQGLARLHLDEINRRELIEALGGVVPAEPSPIGEGNPVHWGDDNRTACGKWSGMVFEYTSDRRRVTCAACKDSDSPVRQALLDVQAEVDADVTVSGSFALAPFRGHRHDPARGDRSGYHPVT